MMKLKGFSLVLILFSTTLFSQTKVRGIVVFNDRFESNLEVKVYESNSGFLETVPLNEPFEIEILPTTTDLIFVVDGFPSIKKTIDFETVSTSFLTIDLVVEELSEVILSAKRKEVFLLKRMEDFDNTEIYAGKKKRSHSH